MTTTAISNKAVMIRAWKIARTMDAAFVRMCGGIRKVFADALRKAWAEIKAAAARPLLTGAQARDALSMLENKDRWNDADRTEANRLRGIAHAESAADYAEKRELIASAKGRFCSVTFIKADGSERVMQVQPAKLAKHVKGDAATEAGKKAVATRKARHPNLLPVWDVAAQAPRSVNLATVSEIQVNGMAHAFQ